MPIRHKIQEGDCISSIAYEHGFFPDTIWNHADNADLRQLRKDPNVLAVDDVVVIPDLRKKQVEVPVEKRHRFRRKGVPERFKLCLMWFGQPRNGLDYTLDIDGVVIKGTTDDKGWLDQPIPPNAKKGRLIISSNEEYEFDLGTLYPIEEEDGAVNRLTNLGYYDPQDKDAEALQEAIEEFQLLNKLDVTGELDQATRDKLLELHGS